RIMVNKARRAPKRVVFPEGESGRILRAAQILIDEKIAHPILLGNRERIRGRALDLRLHLDDATVIDPAESPRSADYAEEFYRLRQRKGVTRTEAAQAVHHPVTFGALMVRLSDADALVGGHTTHYPETIRPALQVIELQPGMRKVAGVYVLITQKGELY